MTDILLQPVIMAGGGGTRLWPLSREHFPKQFLALVGEQTLLQQTLTRLDGLDGVRLEAPMVITNEAHRFQVAEQARVIAHELATIMLEPAARNTAPALTAAAMAVLDQHGDRILLAMPADHVVRDAPAFRRAVSAGAALAAQQNLVTFGIVPDRPETGYGYIRRGQALEGAPADCVYRLVGFEEKPSADKAQSYLDSGDFYWNSGIFMMRASVWLECMRKFNADIYRAVETAYAEGHADGEFYRLDAAAFEACPADSIDYAVMEPVAREESVPCTVVALDAGWSDVGSWASLAALSEADAQGNSVVGDGLALASTGTMIIAEHRLACALGCEDLVVVETADAVLVAAKDHAQEVKQVVEWLRGNGREERVSHRRVYRPWGTYETVDAGDRFQVKRIVVQPGGKLSSQMHHHRAEHWIVVRGTAKVTRDGKEFLLSENESTYIPLGTQHRLENPGAIPLELIEVQSGAYLGEDDIVRFEDVYRRA